MAESRASGKITSKNLGSARLVKIQKALPDDPALMTISRNLRDCVRKIIRVSTTAINTVAIAKFLRR